MTIKQRLSLRDKKPAAAEAQPWPILVVDDDPQVHEMTRVLLRDFQYQGRPFDTIAALSAEEAKRVLAERHDMPLMLLDVVMETGHAGLDLARHLREDLGERRMRIILRTGQPGEAPERQVMLDYDINDYRAKTELTAQKLFTAVVGALRSWQQIDTIETLNATLEARVQERTRELAEARAFAERLVEMLPNPVWLKDGEGRYSLYNRAFREFFAIGEQCWQGLTAPEALGERLPEAELSSDAQLLQGAAERLEFETTLKDGGGSDRALMVAKTVMPAEDGAVGGIIGLITDITERKGLERELRRLATVDSLTGASNRRHFMAMAAQELDRAVRYDLPLSVVMIDVDLFKTVNDRHGHGMGDEVLRRMVEACRSALRDIDVLGRLGGEEFAVLVPQTGLAGALGLAERLRRVIGEIIVPAGGQDIRISISQGVAERRPAECLFEHLLARADSALYLAKSNGRDRVECAEA